ncbi:unnamed protein product [Rotaria sordida]|uniref:N-acetyltransferase domain-containing protein n=1 Tax=Rotaria sordida TaxID=392033 RepID=A0A813XIR3_9BILA|nr:unnamed protein product [Rotaria sordida]
MSSVYETTDRPKEYNSSKLESLLPIESTFYIKPNFPGRYSHICNGGFITSNIYRNQGIGRIMALAFIKITPLLCYKASMFNLVFSNNTFSIRLWRSLGFQEIGRILNAGYLIKKKETTKQINVEIEEEFVDAIMFYYSFT